MFERFLRVRRSASVVLAVSVVAAVGACGMGASETSIGSGSSTIKTRLVTDPSGFDPTIGKAVDDYVVSRLLFDTLLRKGDGNTMVSGLASAWNVESASEYEFTIRSDATCADGTKITATVVADSLRRFADPETGSAVRLLTFGGGPAPTITADDEAGTVEVKLAQDWADLPAGLTLPQAGIVCPAGLSNLDGLKSGTVPGAFSGPYVLDKATPAVSYELALRSEYDEWPKFEPALEGKPAESIILTPVADQTTIANQLLSGALDTANLVDDNVKRLIGQEGFSTQSVVSSVLFLIFNQRGGVATADPELRRAIVQAVDAEAFNNVVTSGRGTRLLSVASPSFPCVNEDESLIPAYDPGSAANVLKGKTLRFVGTTSLNSGNEFVAEVLRKAGATVDLQAVDGATWATTTGGGTAWDFTLQGDVNQLGTMPGSLLRVMGPLTEDGGRNKGGSENKAGYEALVAAMSEPDDAARCGLLEQAQREMLNRADVAPLSTFPATVVTKDGISVRVFGDYLDPATLRVTG